MLDERPQRRCHKSREDLDPQGAQDEPLQACNIAGEPVDRNRAADGLEGRHFVGRTPPVDIAEM